MPTVTNRKLTMTRAGTPLGTKFNVLVTYTVNFSQVESNLVGLGMTFADEAVLIGVDPPGGTTGTPLRLVGGGLIPVTGKNQSQAIERKHEAVVSRVLLDEDPDTIFKDDDEIRCRIQVSSPNLSTNLTQAFTDQVILDVPVNQ
jgi:hypothetical protein